MSAPAKTFKHVNYLWDDAKAAQLKGDEVALLLYRSNILGADLRITNYGGGNTSCKTMEKDPLTGKEVEVMWIKGSVNRHTLAWLPPLQAHRSPSP